MFDNLRKLLPANATTSQSLGALLKSARDIMRKDKGLNGDLDPMLTWITFLKFLDDLELQREDEAKLARSKFKGDQKRAVVAEVEALQAEVDALKPKSL